MSAARNTPTRGRFVWIGEYESIERLGAVEFARIVTKRRAEAPADPVEAVWKALTENYLGAPHRGQCDAVLRALGGFPLETT